MTLFYMSGDGNWGVINDEFPLVIFDGDKADWEDSPLMELLDSENIRGVLLLLRQGVPYKVLDSDSSL